MAGLTPNAKINVENPFKPSWTSRAIVVAVVAYLFYSVSTLGLTFDRLIIGFGESERLISRMIPPDFSRTNLLLSGLAESLQIAIISSFFGIVISLFLGLLAARKPDAFDCVHSGARLYRIMPFVPPSHHCHLVC